MLFRSLTIILLSFVAYVQLLAVFRTILGIDETVTVGVGVNVGVAEFVGVGLRMGLLVMFQELTEAPAEEVNTKALNLVPIPVLTVIDLLLLAPIDTLELLILLHKLPSSDFSINVITLKSFKLNNCNRLLL